MCITSNQKDDYDIFDTDLLPPKKKDKMSTFDKKLLKQTYYVGPGKQFQTIQKAIDKASPDMIIEVSPGLYNENLRIEKPIKIIAKKSKKYNQNNCVVLIAVVGPVIFINISNEQRCQLQGIKVLCTGEADDYVEVPSITPSNPQDKDEKLRQMKNLQLKNYGKGVGNPTIMDKCTPIQEFVTKLQVDQKDTTLLYLKSGKLFLDDCVFSGA